MSNIRNINSIISSKTNLFIESEVFKLIIRYIFAEIDDSGSTAGAIFQKECYWATRFCSEFGNKVTGTFGLWNTTASRIVSNDVKNLTPMNGGTDPSCITKNSIHMNSIKQSDLFIFVTDGSIDSSSVKRASESFGNTLTEKVVIAIIVGGRFNPDQVNVSAVLPIISKSQHYVILYSDYNTDYLTVLKSEGAFDYTVDAERKDYPIFDMQRLVNTTFNVNKMPTGNYINIAPGIAFNMDIQPDNINNVPLSDLETVINNFDSILLHYHTIGKHDLLRIFLNKFLVEARRGIVAVTNNSNNEIGAVKNSTEIAAVPNNGSEIDQLVEKVYASTDDSERLALRFAVEDLIRTTTIAVKAIRKDNRSIVSKINYALEKLENMRKAYSSGDMSISSISNRLSRSKDIPDISADPEPDFTDAPEFNCGILFDALWCCILLVECEDNSAYVGDFALNFPLAAGVTMGKSILPILVSWDVANKLTLCPMTRQRIVGILPVCDLSKSNNLQLYRNVLGRTFMDNKDVPHVLTMFFAGLSSRVPEWIISNDELSKAVNYIRTQLYTIIKVPEYLNGTVSTKSVNLIDAINMLSKDNYIHLMRQPMEAFNIIIDIMHTRQTEENGNNVNNKIEHLKQIRAARQFVSIALSLYQTDRRKFNEIANNLKSYLFDTINGIIPIINTGHLLSDDIFGKTILRKESSTILAISIFNELFRHEHLDNCINTLMNSGSCRNLVRMVFTAPLDITADEVCKMVNAIIDSPLYGGLGRDFATTMGPSVSICIYYDGNNDNDTGSIKIVPFVPEFMEFKSLTIQQVQVLNKARAEMFKKIYNSDATPTASGKSSNLHKSIMVALSDVKFSTVVTDELVDRVVVVLATEKGNPFIPTIKNSIRYSVQSYIDVHIKENGGVAPDTFKQYRKYSVQEKWTHELQFREL
jgi:hypothetical protein